MDVLDHLRNLVTGEPRQMKNHNLPIHENVPLIDNGLAQASHNVRVLRGFRQNAVVYRCVQMVAEACATIPLELHNAEQQFLRHPLLELVRQPNPSEAGPSFFEALYGHLLLSGNAYIHCQRGGNNQPVALYCLRPERMRVLADKQGWPYAYEYRVGSQVNRFEQPDHTPPILHLRLFNPQDDHYGLSPLEAAANAIDLHNSAGAWNRALFDNAARPSGALVYKTRDGTGRLSDEQFNRLKKELETNFQGSRNAGRPLLLEGGLDWSAISLSPQDMDFINARQAAAREIALAFGVPPMLLGLPGDNTYANYAEANRALWRQTVLPLVMRVVASLSSFLCTEADLHFVTNMDAVPALSEEREHLWRRIDNASFLTDAEKRRAVGYASENEAMPAPDIDAGADAGAGKDDAGDANDAGDA